LVKNEKVTKKNYAKYDEEENLLFNSVRRFFLQFYDLDRSSLSLLYISISPIYIFFWQKRILSHNHNQVKYLLNDKFFFWTLKTFQTYCHHYYIYILKKMYQNVS